MANVDAIIEHGNVTVLGSLVDEPNILVRNLTITPTRTKQEYMGVNRAVQGVQYRNPTVALSFQAYISTLAGFADQHPGTQVTELANYATGAHGFDPLQGTMIYEDPVRTLDQENDDEVSFTVMHYPFVVPAVVIP